jgi:hypothetical protein
MGDPMNGVGPPPDLNGATRGLGYGGMYNQGGGRFGGQGGKRPGGMPQPQGFDYDAFNAWQDPSIGGEQPGPIQEGWGGIGSISGRGSGGGLLATKMNNYLNQFETGGDRENVMNQMGYFNGGNAFDPASVRGSGINRFNRQNAQQNQQTGGFSAPGTYQHTNAAGYAPGVGDPQSSNWLNFGGYIGNTTVGEDGSAQYSPLSPAGRTRRTRTFGDVRY